MRPFAKAIVNRSWKPFVQWYLRKPRSYMWRSVTVNVPPGIFHPGFFFSTKQLLNFLEQQPLQGKTLLEIGSGSGIVSIFAAKKGAVVTCCDISPRAVETTIANAKANSVSIDAMTSDLFANVPSKKFELIAVNPPYYRKDPLTTEEHAWYAGKELDYFSRFFRDAKSFLAPGGNVLMVLSDECDLSQIQRIAEQNDWHWEIASEQHTFFERGLVIRLSVEK